MVTQVTASGGSDRFVHLATLGDIATARVCAALLESEGIDVRVHGEALGPYPMTIGEFATTQLWIPEGRIDQARRIMLEAEVEASFPNPDDQPDRPVEPWLVWTIIGTTVALIVVRAVTNFL